MTRKLYITDAMLKRKGACNSVRHALNELLGTKTRKVPVNYYTAFAVEILFGRITWAVDWLLTNKQQQVYWRERGEFPSGTDDLKRTDKRARAFVTAYYSPKK